MKIIFIILFYFTIVTMVFSQSPKCDLILFSKSKTISVDSCKTNIPIVALINYNRIDKFLTSGMQWGSVAIVVGAVLETAFNPDDYFKYAMTALGGMIASAGGLAYGAFSDIPKGYNVGKKNFGFQINMGQTMAEDSYRYIGNFGFIFRNSQKSYYIPDNYTLYIGGEELRENITETKHSKLNLAKYGIQLRKLRYDKVVSFIYGVDFGMSNGTYSFSIEKDLSYFHSESKNVSSFYFDIIVGANFNLTKNIHGSIEYQYELLGASRKNGVMSIFNSPAHGVTSFSIYTFLW